MHEDHGWPALAGAATTGVRATQLSALTPGVKLVTVTVGGNDLGFARLGTTEARAFLGRLGLELFLEPVAVRPDDIRIDDARHGPAGDRRFTYVPTFILRGLTELHLVVETA